MRKIWNNWTVALALVSIGFAFPGTASAQKTFKGDDYAITFSAGWDTVSTSFILRKHLGLSGIATLGAEPGSTLPNIDSISTAMSDTLGGTITKDSSGVKTIGKYQVHWQKFKYDSLPKLSAQIMAQVPMAAPLKNGSFRVYYLNADGVSFTIAAMSVVRVGSSIPPYEDVETALETLKLGALAGINNVARTGGRDLWVRDGRLGGSWLKANRVFAVECFDSRGALIGVATHATEGTWKLPVSSQEMFVRLRTAVGTGLHLIVRP
ncbi:MAG: hypothetical protein M3Y08_06370 [Fibrobacterota bacterium]|nr:hypothetical protein [Fibrobacterota bacterium]